MTDCGSSGKCFQCNGDIVANIVVVVKYASMEDADPYSNIEDVMHFLLVVKG